MYMDGEEWNMDGTCWNNIRRRSNMNGIWWNTDAICGTCWKMNGMCWNIDGISWNIDGIC